MIKLASLAKNFRRTCVIDATSLDIGFISRSTALAEIRS